MARRLTDPIAVTANPTRRLPAGDCTARIEQPQMGPELAALAESVNLLAQRLEDTERSRIQLIDDLASVSPACTTARTARQRGTLTAGSPGNGAGAHFTIGLPTTDS